MHASNEFITMIPKTIKANGVEGMVSIDQSKISGYMPHDLLIAKLTAYSD